MLIPCLIYFIQRETHHTYKKLQAVSSDRDHFLGWSLDSACVQCANSPKYVHVCISVEFVYHAFQVHSEK